MLPRSHRSSQKVLLHMSSGTPCRIGRSSHRAWTGIKGRTKRVSHGRAFQHALRDPLIQMPLMEPARRVLPLHPQGFNRGIKVVQLVAQELTCLGIDHGTPPSNCPRQRCVLELRLAFTGSTPWVPTSAGCREARGPHSSTFTLRPLSPPRHRALERLSVCTGLIPVPVPGSQTAKLRI